MRRRTRHLISSRYIDAAAKGGCARAITRSLKQAMINSVMKRRATGAAFADDQLRHGSSEERLSMI